MLDDESLDAVQITSPHDFHYGHVVDASNRTSTCSVRNRSPRGRPCRDLAQRAEASDRVMMVGYQRHVNPAYVETRDAVLDGEIAPEDRDGGTHAGLDPERRWDVARRPDMSGGGQLYDSGSHLLDAIIWLIDEVPTRVTADMEYVDEAQRVDVQAVLTVRFADDTVASIAVSGDAPDISERITVRGDGGHAILEGTGWGPREATIRAPTDGPVLGRWGPLVVRQSRRVRPVRPKWRDATSDRGERVLRDGAHRGRLRVSARTGESVAVETDLSATEQSTPEQ